MVLSLSPGKITGKSIRNLRERRQEQKDSAGFQ